ncbi:phosphate ABC transporter permease PstA [Pleionea mediterranea]|jgi:phosphate transport system permease protein|uniref:Phosphate transport system permease protein PstA n=1 Tax=Pleionea mediterranea TaxID=523701 RepID=A0A316G1C8_9GAMM|nr:phosphate ABC transporter permease PstA [Pleionea mediterranea]PWK54185.1 phosphate ABC transporter membrane protein 2 (PhoT family) [Pleionea mediterranea]
MREKFFKSGEHWVWFNAGAIAISIIMVVSLIALIAIRGLSHFWPANVHVYQTQLDNGTQQLSMGELYDEEVPKGADPAVEKQILLKVGNRDLYGLDFRWLKARNITDVSMREDVMVIERREWGNFYGFVENVRFDGKNYSVNDETFYEKFQMAIDRANELHDTVKDLEKGDIGSINYQLEQLRLDRRRLELENEATDEALADIAQREQALKDEFEVLQAEMFAIYDKANRDSVDVVTIDGKPLTIKASNIVMALQPNQMSWIEKVGHYFIKVAEFIFDEPREANTEGGVFPAIFGTVMMVILMSIMVTPFGVVAAVYLHEYAKQGFLTRTIRIAVNNLAGVPSIVYGVFGLGFFVYFLGGSIDELFYPEAKPAPTFGTSGLLWASITLALLTLPVVIVSTEEGLSRIPKSIREGSLALGATKVETLWRTVLPMASPAMMTGLILAIARAAGEVAPLMLVGVVKLAPTLPLDGNAPFIHLERKFMHLGFHIYDVGFQSPNVEAARPLVYATAFLLVLVIILLNITAIKIRNRLREKYKSLEH